MASLVIGKPALITASLLIARGANYVAKFRYKAGDPTAPINLSSWTARSQIRDKIGGDVWLTATNSDYITLTSDGYITLALPHALTESSDWDKRVKGVWDLELTNAADKRIRFAEGPVVISQDVTRAT